VSTGSAAHAPAAALAQLPAFALADLLTSGTVGPELTEALQEHFATISRGEVFLGLRIAASIWAADLLEAGAERDTLRLDLDTALIELSYLRRQVEIQGAEGAWLRIAAVPDPAMREVAHA
jgi:hypothetical protein